MDVSTVNAATVQACLDVFRRLQCTGDLSREEKEALRTLGDWLGAHISDLSDDPASVAEELAARLGVLQPGSLPLAQAYSSFYRANPACASREAMLRRQYTTRSSGNLVAGEPQGTWSCQGSPRGTQSLTGEEPGVGEALQHLTSLDRFDVFSLQQLNDGRALETVGLSLLQRLGLVTELQLPGDKLKAYLRAIERHYPNNPYHNSTHAADVTQTLAWLLCEDGLDAVFTPLELLAVVLGAIVHDVNHTGYTNEFLIRTRSELSTTYNDASVNENFHLATAWRLLQRPGMDCLAHLSADDWAFVRSLTIDIVMATDMKAHHKLLADFAADVALFGPSLGEWSAVARTRALCMLMHCADLGNTIKPPPLCLKWAKAVTTEFWQQGDAELALGLSVSPLNNRAAAHIPKSQKVFLSLVVRPCFDGLAQVAPKASVAALAQLDRNAQVWEQLDRAGVTDMLPADVLEGALPAGGGGGGGAGVVARGPGSAPCGEEAPAPDGEGGCLPQRSTSRLRIKSNTSAGGG